jgi:stress-induced morphogen
MVDPSVVEERIRAGIPDVELVTIEDLTGTRDHYRAVVVSASFRGKTRIEQHQAVYAALGELMSGPVHALALATFTPEGWAARQGDSSR